MVVNLLGSVAQWERETTVERTVAALDYKQSRGEWCGRIPFGFKVGEDGHLTEASEAVRVISAIKRSRRRSGTSYPKLAKQYGLSVGTVYKIVQTDLRVLTSCLHAR
jgi:DNA invertase Pin-like site-specific DNA recombinase